MVFRKFVIAMLAVSIVFSLSIFPGCGKKEENNQSAIGPEYVTAYEAIQFCKPKASKWERHNWVVYITEEDPEGLTKEGKARIWVAYFFTPEFEEDNMLMVQYNRGNVWPQTPADCKGGERGRKTYSENEPRNFRVDSPEAYQIAMREGGSEYLKSHPDAKVHAILRCKADYDAVSEEMPAPKYEWIWDIYYRVPLSLEIFHVYIDGMTGDYITKETNQPPGQ